jgi:hypothetical protein
MGIDGELLPECKLHDRLFFTAPDQGEKATKESDEECDQHPHGDGILRNFSPGNESESTD